MNQGCLLQEWGDDRTDTLKLDDNQNLAAAIESALAVPTIQELGPAAQATLGVIAAYPDGVGETKVGMFPTIDSVEVVGELCRFCLMERHDGFVRMLSPFRFPFLQPALTMVYVHEDEGNNNLIVEVEEYICCDCLCYARSINTFIS
jgi:hypothetical protein